MRALLANPRNSDDDKHVIHDDSHFISSTIY